MTNCFVCCEKYNKSINSKIKCNLCDYETCKKCTRYYILNSSNQPHCMNCKVMWNKKFLIDNLNRSFVDKELKEYRSKILLEETKTKLIDYMYLMEKEKKKIKLEEEMQNINKEINELYKIINEKQQIKFNLKNKIENFEYNNKNNEKKKFIMSCRNNNCKGYLSKQYKCELCDLFTCSKCYEIIGTIEDKKNHICKKENIESTELIKKESKSCPGCGIRIQKISGCSQMYCVECKTTFDYNSLKIQYGGIIHNPHYYEMKKKENKKVPEVLEQILCDGLIEINLLNNLLKTLNLKDKIINDKNTIIISFYKKLSENDKLKYLSFEDLILNLYRYINEINNLYIDDINNKISNIDEKEKLKLIIDYLFNKIDDNILKNKLLIFDINKNKYIEKIHLYELVYSYGKDIINSIYNNAVNYLIEKKESKINTETMIKLLFINNLEELNKIINYCNKELAIHSFINKTRLEGFDNIYNVVSLKKYNNYNNYNYNYNTRPLLYLLYENNLSITKEELNKILSNDNLLVEDIIKERKPLATIKLEKKKAKEEKENKKANESSSNGITKEQLNELTDSEED